MLFRNIGKRVSALVITSAFLGALLIPISRSNQVEASYNQNFKYNARTLHIKLKDQSAINSVALNSILDNAGHIKKIAKLFDNTSKNSAQVSLGNALRNYYTVHFDRDIDMVGLVNRLKGLNEVETAYPEVKPAPSPTSPDFSSFETYLKSAPTGINSNYAQTFPGAMGGKVKIVDIEYSWNTAHEDLTKAATAIVPHGTPVDPFSDNNHGTAVLGEMEASNNGIGTTGAVYNAQLALVNAYSNEYGYDVVGALNTAASVTQPGDVIQIEQQTWGPTPDDYDYVPIEWIPEVYDAIHSLTNSGRIVVEPAGNGSQNLDDISYYGSSFPMGKVDSGAIIVGAGENCSNSTPLLSRLTFSDYGKRVNLQGPGDCVATSGYGGLYNTDGENAYYTQYFAGTSSATPIVSSAAASLSSAYKYLNASAILSPIQIRSILMLGSTPQNTSTGSNSGNIGPYPDLYKDLLKADIKAPSIPQSFSATQISASPPKITVKWAASSDNVKVYTYRLYRNNVLYKTFGATTLSYIDTYNLIKGKTYSYKIVAVDRSGNVSAFSVIKSIVVH